MEDKAIIGTPTPRIATYLEGFHSQLLVDVTAIGETLDKHAASLPAIYTEFDAKILAMTNTASKATAEFKAMGISLMTIVSGKTEENNKQSISTSLAVAKTIKESHEVFTRYFWLLIGMAALNFIALSSLLIAVLVTRRG